MLEDRVVPSNSNGPFFFPGFLGSAATAAQAAQPIATTTTVSSSANPEGFGQVVSFTATIAGQNGFGGGPTGTVQFAIDGANTSDPVNVRTTNGVTTATYSTSLQFLGTHTITASYSGDSNFVASSGSLTQTVILRTPSTTTVSSSLSSSVIGQTVAFTATVAGLDPSAGPPTGTVLFAIDGNITAPVNLTTTGGVSTAAYSTDSLSAGPHVVAAAYTGNASLNGGSGYLPGVLEVATASTSTTVSSSSNPSAPGQSVTFTARVSAPSLATFSPTGSVQFVIDGGLAGLTALTPAGNGVYTASYTTSSLAAGTHSVTANYSGDTNFDASSGTLASGQIVGNGTPFPGGGGGGGDSGGSGNGGSGGTVIVTMNPGTGVLDIIGYNDNDALTLSQGAGTLQIAGNGTFVGQSASPLGVPLNSVSEIDISLLNGSDSLAISNLSIPGTLSITAGSGSDNLSLGTISAGLIRISVTGPGNSIISLNNTTAGTINIVAGDNATLSLSGVNNTGAVMLTAGNNASISVIGLTTSGDLDITAADNAQSITVQNSNSDNLSILQTGASGSPSFDFGKRHDPE